MKEKLFNSDKLEVRMSPIDGYGVFAKEDIRAGELLEECHLVKYMNIKYGVEPDIDRVKFAWPKGGGDIPTAEFFTYGIPLGFGAIYNSANTKGTANADWESDIENKLLVFSAIKDIKKDEEIQTYYYNSI